MKLYVRNYIDFSRSYDTSNPIVFSDYNRTSRIASVFSIKKKGLRWIKASRTQIGFAYKDMKVCESNIRASIKEGWV
jgi:hypothetical protein